MPNDFPGSTRRKRIFGSGATTAETRVVVPTTMSIDALRPNKSDDTADDESMTMAQLENALHQRPAVIDCPGCGADIRLTRSDLYAIGSIAQLTCENSECYFEDLVPHSWLQNNLTLPDDLEVEQ